MQAAAAEAAAAALHVQQVQAEMMIQLESAEEQFAELNKSNGRRGNRTNERKNKLAKLEFAIAALKRGEWPKDAAERVRAERRAAIVAFAAKKHAIAARAAHHASAPDLRGGAASSAANGAAAAAAAPAAGGGGAGAEAVVVCGPDETENDLLPLGVNRNYFAISDAQAAFDATVRDEMLRGVGGERVSGGYYLWRVPHFIEQLGSSRCVAVKPEYMYDPKRFYGCDDGFCASCGPDHRSEITTKGITRE